MEAKKGAKSAKKEAKVAKKKGYKGRDMDAVLSEAERSRILSGEVKKMMGFGSNWRVEAKGDTFAQLVDPAADPIGTGGTVMAIATLGLSLATTPVRRGRDQDKGLYISVEPNGVVEKSGAFWYAGTDYSHVPMLGGE